MVRKRHKRKKPVWVIGLLILLALAGGLLAKYVSETGGEILFWTKEFYFTSDLLGKDAGEYILNSSTTEVQFTVENHADELRVSQENIQYTIAVECEKGLQDGEAMLDKKSGTLEKDQVSTETITLSNLKAGKTYIVTATGKAGYKKTIKTAIRVSDKEENVYKHLDVSNSAYVTLTIWTENAKGTASIQFPEGLIPDSTDPVLENVYNYNSENKKYETDTCVDVQNFTKTYSSHTYRFFKDTESDVTISSFNVTFKDGETNYEVKDSIP